MCIFVSRPMKIVAFLRKNGYSPKRVVAFHREKDTFRDKIMEIVKNFDEKSYNNNGKPWKSSRILRLNPIFSFFFFFHHFSPFFFLVFFSIFHFFSFFIFLTFFYFFKKNSFFSFFFSFFHFFIFSHFFHLFLSLHFFHFF